MLVFYALFTACFFFGGEGRPDFIVTCAYNDSYFGKARYVHICYVCVCMCDYGFSGDLNVMRYVWCSYKVSFFLLLQGEVGNVSTWSVYSCGVFTVW